MIASWAGQIEQEMTPKDMLRRLAETYPFWSRDRADEEGPAACYGITELFRATGLMPRQMVLVQYLGAAEQPSLGFPAVQVSGPNDNAAGLDYFNPEFNARKASAIEQAARFFASGRAEWPDSRTAE